MCVIKWQFRKYLPKFAKFGMFRHRDVYIVKEEYWWIFVKAIILSLKHPKTNTLSQRRYDYMSTKHFFVQIANAWCAAGGRFHAKIPWNHGWNLPNAKIIKFGHRIKYLDFQCLHQIFIQFASCSSKKRAKYTGIASLYATMIIIRFKAGFNQISQNIRKCNKKKKKRFVWILIKKIMITKCETCLHK